jgi:hypothetical protein
MRTRYCCMDCGTDTSRAGEYYMVRRELWKLLAPEGRGSLCIGCLERRFGWTLKWCDFTPCRLNEGAKEGFYQSPRLRNRLRRKRRAKV